MTARDDVELREAISQRLKGQLSNAGAADRLAQLIFDVALTWRPSEIPMEEVDTIIAFALGLREEVANDPTAVAGPVNEAIAASVVEMAARRPSATIYAQWEIARILHHRHGLTQAISIDRQVDEDGVVYLSTWGVAEQAIAHAGGVAATLGRVAVAAHQDHAWRCVDFCRKLQIDAYVPAGIALAQGYDIQSVQPFTLDADRWQIYDLAIRINGERQRILGF